MSDESLLETSAVVTTRLQSLCTAALASKISVAESDDQEILLKTIDGFPVDLKAEVLAQLDSTLSLDQAGTWIEDEGYWKRRYLSSWPKCLVERHGNSWKQAYFEKLVEQSIESFEWSKDNMNDLRRLLCFARKFIHRLEISKLPSRIDLEILFEAFGGGPAALSLRYGPGDVGMGYEGSLLGMKISDSRSLAKAIGWTEVLISLDISNNLVDDDKLRIICSGLLENVSLTELDLSKNNISDRGARALAKVIQHSGVMTKVDLSDNCIFLDGAEAMTRAIRVNSSLSTLDLSLNRLEDRGTKAILQAAVGHPCLARLKLDGNAAGSEAAEALCELLRRNSTIRSLEISSNDFSGCEEEILSAFRMNSTIEKLALIDCGLRQDVLTLIRQSLIQKFEDGLPDRILS